MMLFVWSLVLTFVMLFCFFIVSCRPILYFCLSVLYFVSLDVFMPLFILLLLSIAYNVFVLFAPITYLFVSLPALAFLHNILCVL